MGTPNQLTEIEIRQTQWAPERKRLYDSLGLYLQLSEAGGKWWRLKYRVRGKEKLLSLGVYPDVTLKEARLRRDAARLVIAAGRDPSAERQEEKRTAEVVAENTFKSVANAWLDHRAPAWTVGTSAAIRASLEAHAYPHIGDKPVAEVTPTDVRLLIEHVDATGAGETAGRVFQRIRAIYRYAIQKELCETDPTYSLRPAEILRPRDVKHRAALEIRELPAFLHAIDTYDSLTTRGALQLLMLTAVRPGELRGARWSEIDETALLWRIDGARMKMKTPHIVPLAPQALEVLDKLREIGDGSDLVFPSDYYPGKPISDGTLNSAIARMGYKGLMTAHGARAIFSTAANEAGFDGDVIEKQLAHEERDGVRAAYNRAQHLAERRRLMAWWADELDRLRLKYQNVVPLQA